MKMFLKCMLIKMLLEELEGLIFYTQELMINQQFLRGSMKYYQDWEPLQFVLQKKIAGYNI